jgi:hypothetical protein
MGILGYAGAIPVQETAMTKHIGTICNPAGKYPATKNGKTKVNCEWNPGRGKSSQRTSNFVRIPAVTHNKWSMSE